VEKPQTSKLLGAIKTINISKSWRIRENLSENLSKDFELKESLTIVQQDDGI
jgi:hypothetical protein